MHIKTILLNALIFSLSFNAYANNDIHNINDANNHNVNDENTHNLDKNFIDQDFVGQDFVENQNKKNLQEYIEINNILLQILDENQKEVKIKKVKGYPLIEINERTFPKIVNNTSGRILLLPSLDGKSPINNKKVTLGSKGITLNAGDELILSNQLIQKISKNKNMTFFQNAKERGFLSLAVFFERIDYPTILPNMDTPPFGNDSFFINENGQRQWIPPKGYPFRKAKNKPDILFYLNYEKL